MKRRELERHLREHECRLHHQGARHEMWYHVPTFKKTPIPKHRDIKADTVRAICRALGIPSPGSL